MRRAEPNLEAVERLDSGVVSRRSLDALEELLRHAFDNVPHYREVLTGLGVSAGTLLHADDLSRFPVLTRAEVRDGLETGKLLAKGTPWRRRVATRTSGSTGTPLRFFCDSAARHPRRQAWRLLDRWAGVRPDDERVWMTVPRPSPQWSPYQPIRTLARAIRFRQPSDLLSIYRIAAEDVPGIVKTLAAKSAPYFIYGMSSAIHFIADRALVEDLRLPNPPRVVIGSTDSFGPRHRRAVSEFFGCPSYSRYGSYEVSGGIAQTCPDNLAVHHVLSELVVAEIVDDAGQPVGPGQRGRVLLTDLTNRVMPLIRYQIGDEATAADGCTCGRPWPVVGEILGRTADRLILENGETLPAVHVELTLFWYVTELTKDISEYQFVQHGPGEIELRFVSRKPLDRSAIEGIRRAMVGALRNMARIEFVRVEAIEPDPNGKRRQVVQGRERQSDPESIAPNSA